jgi:hypothetical protein
MEPSMDYIGFSSGASPLGWPSSSSLCVPERVLETKLVSRSMCESVYRCGMIRSDNKKLVIGVISLVNYIVTIKYRSSTASAMAFELWVIACRNSRSWSTNFTNGYLKCEKELTSIFITCKPTRGEKNLEYIPEIPNSGAFTSLIKIYHECGVKREAFPSERSKITPYPRKISDWSRFSRIKENGRTSRRI